MAETLRIELYAKRGETSRFIDVVVDPAGGLVMTAQDIGRAPMEFWGDGDYEFWVAVAAEHKEEVRRALLGERTTSEPPLPTEGDRLLLALIAERYRGDPRAVDAFKAFLDERGIASTFGNWV